MSVLGCEEIDNNSIPTVCITEEFTQSVLICCACIIADACQHVASSNLLANKISDYTLRQILTKNDF